MRIAITLKREDGSRYYSAVNGRPDNMPLVVKTGNGDLYYRSNAYDTDDRTRIYERVQEVEFGARID